MLEDLRICDSLGTVSAGVKKKGFGEILWSEPFGGGVEGCGNFGRMQRGIDSFLSYKTREIRG